MSVFGDQSTYRYIHHRALNDFPSLQRATRLVRRYSQFRHAFEGDLCWNFTPGRDDLYFRHPKLIFDSLSVFQIDRLKRAGALVTIEDLKSIARENICLAIELKIGKGDKAKALEKLLSFLECHFCNRYWIDGFSLSLLRQVKKTNATSLVTLHTEVVANNRIFIAAPELSLPAFRPLHKLTDVDGIAIRWRGTDKFMKRASVAVLTAGKILILSRIHSQRQLRLSKSWGAAAAYMHGEVATNFEQDKLKI